MGNLIKINIYAEQKKVNGKKIGIENIEKNILDYNNWLEINKREDKIENFERFLHAQ